MPRRSVNLRTLPLYLQYLLASFISAIVMFVAWYVGRNRPAPGWLGPVMGAWIWIGPGLLAFFVIKALLKWARRRAAPGEMEKPPRRDA